MKTKLFFFSFLISLLLLTGCKAKPQSSPSSGKTPSSKKEDYVAFSDFWKEVQKAADQWGGKVYVTKISAYSVGSFPCQQGLANGWEAHIVKCEELKEKKDFDTQKMETVCRGPLKQVALMALPILEFPKGVSVQDDDFPYYGPAVELDQIKIGAAEAEEKANAYKNYQPTGNEDYVYALKIERFGNIPIWNIQKQCRLGADESECQSADHWGVYVNATTGEIITD